ncbi:MAG: hypothetical protein D8M59_00175 [Planctomycetes bacterium]|nr:hypothetical protein [Planctomycetota bacterium]NOG54866.1 tetratricopeptide repeat protein [Planctomycetota bacterium]
MPLAWFNKKKDDQNGTGDQPGDVSTQSFEVQPEKARAWIERAQHAADTYNYEYAIECFLRGIKFDPTDEEIHRRLLEVANLYRQSQGGKPASGKKVREMLADKRPVDRLAATELAWVTDFQNPHAAVKFMQVAADLGLGEIAYWAADLGAQVALRHKKRSKNLLVSFVNVFEQIGASDKAVEYGEFALQLDRSDAQLEARVRNLSAQATMDRGKYAENVGEEGGFRASVKDIDKQKELVDDDSYAVGADAAESRLGRAKALWESEPENQDAIARYADLLRKMGTDEHDVEAIKVLRSAYKTTGQYRFRMLAGDIHLTRERRKYRAERDKAEESGDEAQLERVKQIDWALTELEAKEYLERSEKYPTELRIKYRLGELLYKLGKYEDAIPVLQQAQEDAQHRARALHYMGLCFAKTDWVEEAIESLRSAVERYEIKDDDTHLTMRYDLMVALERFAREHEALDEAEEAGKIASGIAMKQLNFRDIRDRRAALRDLVKELKNPAAGT